MTKLKIITVLVLALFVVGASSQAPPRQAKEDDRYTSTGQLRKPSQHSGLPVVGELEGPQESPQDGARRQIREKRYSSYSTPRQVVDLGPLVDGQAESTNLRFIDYVVVGKPIDPMGIPTSISTAVVVGTVLGGKVFVNKDHTFVYTDYQVRVDQILKQDPTANLTVGGLVIAAREGGAVRFPSGHVENFLISGRGLPAIGSQYVLFLVKPIPNFPEYDIILDAGYQVKNGRVYPLDDVNSRYVGVDVAVFLDEVQKAIAASQNGGIKP